MSDLPVGWEWAELGELGKWYGGATPSKKVPGYWQGGTIPWLSPKDMGPETLNGTQDRITETAVHESPVRLVPEESVALVVRSGILAHTMPVAFVPFATALNQDMKALVPYDGIGGRWVAWALRSYAPEILQACRKTGTTVASLEVPRLMHFRIPLAPPPEQQRILDVLEDHLARLALAIGSLKNALSLLDTYGEHLTALAATGGFCPAAERGDSPLSDVGLNDGDLPPIPVGWKWHRLGAIAEMAGGVTKDSKKQSIPGYVEVPYLRVANVQRGRLILDSVTTIRVPAEKAEQLRLEPGDVLLNEGGDRDKLGRGWVWEGQIADCIHQNHVFRARVKDGVIHPKLLAWQANSFGKDWCDRNGRQTVNLASISLNKIKMLPVAVPPPSTAQEDIVGDVESKLSIADRSRQLAQTALGRGIQLKSKILQAAFTGQLIPQQWTGEQVQALPERITDARSSGRRAGRGRQSQLSGEQSL